ncbi:MAG: hypothetical protein NZM31_11870, partial [Gemmatales bacterium]|nr:hypothetical protein [Gemmatales bacterium]MDW8387692.1 hypothetical protein [Gemmatales bacterium]
MDITPSDWDTLQSLAERAGLPCERIGALRKRLETDHPRPGSPYILLVGQPNCGLELVLAKLVGPAAAEEVKKAVGRPVVLGPKPTEVQPRLGAWATYKWPKCPQGHVIVLCSPGRPSAVTLAQLESLGYVEEVVLVTRLGQPLHQSEREMAQALSTVAATIHVLVVALPGEEASDSDMAEVKAYGLQHMRLAGFNDGRCQGVLIWFVDGRPRQGTVSDFSRLFTLEPVTVASGRDGLVRQALRTLLDEMRQKAESKPPSPQIPISDEECDRLTKELDSYLADLGKKVNRWVQKYPSRTALSVREFVHNELRGWAAYTTIEGSWLKYVEHLRPGMQ